MKALTILLLLAAPAFSVQSLCSLCLCGDLGVRNNNHRVTENTEVAQRKRVQQDMSRWAGKYPDEKFTNQPAIRIPLRRILTKDDYESILAYNLMIPIKRIGDYLVTYAAMKYSDPLESLNLVYNLKDKSVYVVFWKEEEHRKFSTKNNQFNLPDEVLKEIGLKEE